MASFRGHIGFGFLVAVLVTGLFVVKSIVTGFAAPSALFIAIVIGSFLPDLDSDTSIVFSMIYSLFTAVALGAAGYWTYIAYGLDWQSIGIAAGITLILTVFIIRPIFKKLTVHRGMFHSIPAALIAGLIGYLSVSFLAHNELLALWFGVGFALGYVTHLILDEIYAGVDLLGHPFRGSKTLGSALKFYSGNSGANTTTYVILCALGLLLIASNIHLI